MAIVEAWNATTDLFLCPLLFVIAVIDFLPNPARFLIRRLVSGQSSPPRRSMIREAGRKILIAVDETSHEAFDWALKSFLDPSKDYIYLLYIPQGDYRRATYRHRMIMNRGNYTSVLPGVDFLWEYCQKLDFANIEFECIVEPLVHAKSVPSSILSKSSALHADMIMMGASKRTGPYKHQNVLRPCQIYCREDVGPTAYQVSMNSSVPVFVIK